MKLGEMADLLSGLGTGLEPFLGKSKVNELRAVAECLREFREDSVNDFRKYMLSARNGKQQAPQSRPRIDEKRVEQLVSKLQHFVANHKSYEYAEIDRMVSELRKMKNDEIKAVGAGIKLRVSGTKAELVSTIGNWLKNQKSSADQATFTLGAVKVG